VNKKKAKYILVYSCQTCGMESGYTELDKPLCRYCDKETVLSVVSKEKLTIEAIAKRLEASADNMMKNLRGAYDSMPEELKKNASKEFDPEKELLKSMAKAKSFNENLLKLKLKKKTRSKKS
jgi:hypothetical protein